MTYTLNQAIDEREKVLINNVVNSLWQLHFHENATADQLEKYYGWDKETMVSQGKQYTPFQEAERGALINDTIVRIEAEQFILRYYQEHKEDLKNKYGEKNPAGDLGLPAKRAIGIGPLQGSASASPLEEGPRRGDENGTGHGATPTPASDGRDDASNSEEEAGAGSDDTGGVRQDDRGGVEARDHVSDRELENFPDETDEVEEAELKGKNNS